MPTIKKFPNLLLVLFAAHFLEEIVTQIWKVDPFLKGFGDQGWWVFGGVQILVFTLLLATARSNDLILRLLVGVLLLFEFDHLIRWVQTEEYYPGLFTGTLLALTAIFYWKNIRSESSPYSYL